MDALVDMVARRGPDGRGLWTDGVACTLGFRRLAILDLRAIADQPMLSADGRFALVYNGEIYNFRQIRAELEQRGHTFVTSGDTEVVLKALIEWGTGALDRFNGMFALALYDCRARSLLLARDHAGIKPLYTLQTRDGLVFGSQYDQLLAHPWAAGLPVSPDGLGLYLRLGYIPAPYAILEQTAMLEPGSWMTVTADGQCSGGRYYEFPMFQQPDLRGPEAYEAVDAAVSAAVVRQMVSDVPLGAFLSGGIDSPLVAAKARAYGTSSLKAFTIGIANSELDESADAIRYASILGLDQCVEFYTADMALGWLDRVVDACSEPFADYSIFPTMLVSAMARKDVTVMLSGDGGDELFWGYAHRFGMVLGDSGVFRQPLWLRTGRRAANRLAGSYTGNGSMRWPTVGDWYRSTHSRAGEEDLAAVFSNIPAWPGDLGLFDYAGWDQDETAQWLRWNEMVGHLTRVLLKVDRASMYSSLEVRVPLLDREVIDLAARIDWRSCLDLESATGKLPLRHSLARHSDFQSAGKRGFEVPMGEWLRGPLLPVFREKVLGSETLLGLPLDTAALDGILADHVSHKADYGRWLWVLLSLALWNERYLHR